MLEKHSSGGLADAKKCLSPDYMYLKNYLD